MRVARGLKARRAHARFTELGFCCWANEDYNSIVGRIGWTKEIQGVVRGGFGPRLGPWLALGPYLTLVPEFLIKKFIWTTNFTVLAQSTFISIYGCVILP
jgi:hypothetical protein